MKMLYIIYKEKEKKIATQAGREITACSIRTVLTKMVQVQVEYLHSYSSTYDKVPTCEYSTLTDSDTMDMRASSR